MPDRTSRRDTKRSPSDRSLEIFPQLPAFALGQGSFNGAGAEPRLAEMLKDPIVHLVMQRDQVSTGDVLSLFR